MKPNLVQVSGNSGFACIQIEAHYSCNSLCVYIIISHSLHLLLHPTVRYPSWGLHPLAHCAGGSCNTSHQPFSSTVLKCYLHVEGGSRLLDSANCSSRILANNEGEKEILQKKWRKRTHHLVVPTIPFLMCILFETYLG